MRIGAFNQKSAKRAIATESSNKCRLLLFLAIILLLLVSQTVRHLGDYGSASLILTSACNNTQTNTHANLQDSGFAKIPSDNISKCLYPSVQNHFDTLYIMYMPQRKEYMQQVVNLYGLADCLPVVYVPAIHKEALSKEWLQQNGQIATPFKSPMGKIANHWTLLKTLRLFLYHAENSVINTSNDQSHHEWMESKCIILEDDIASTPAKDLTSWWQRFSEIVVALETLDWDYVNFGRCYASCQNDQFVSTNIVHYTQAACTHAVGYSYKGALEAMRIYLPLPDRSNDLVIADQIVTGQFHGKAYQITPTLFQQNETMGSMLMNHGKSWKKPECNDAQS